MSFHACPFKPTHPPVLKKKKRIRFPRAPNPCSLDSGLPKANSHPSSDVSDPSSLQLYVPVVFVPESQNVVIGA
jgi:hypothetical protein